MRPDADETVIARLLHAYADGIDRGDFRAVADLFADGSWNTRIGAQEAYDYLRANMILYSGTPRTAHVLSDVVIEVLDGETARARSRCTVWQSPPVGGLHPIAVMHYDDRFRRSRGRWAFHHRDGTMLLAGDLSGHLRGSPPGPTGHDHPATGGGGGVTPVSDVVPSIIKDTSSKES